MTDRPFIIAGLAVFVGAITFPLWYNLAARTQAAAPALERPSPGAIARVRDAARNLPGSRSRNTLTTCVAPRDFMRASHMQLVAAWRDDVVRRAERAFVAYDGQRYERSLTRACFGCHEDTSRFCDRCHQYAGVNPKCVDCHVRRQDQSQRPPAPIR